MALKLGNISASKFYVGPNEVSSAYLGATQVYSNDPYYVGNFLSPELTFDFGADYYRTNGADTTFPNAIIHSRASNATMVDSDGILKWAPHNLALNSSSPSTQTILVIPGASYTVECTGVAVTLSGAGTGTATQGNPVELTASTTSLTLTVAGSVGTMWCYRSDLGGMVNNPDTGSSYVPTTISPVYLSRRNHHVYNGSVWVNEGLLVESEARTNLLLNSSALATQNVTVTAVPHTLHFTGNGTVTLSGASTDGPLIGVGTGEENRVSLTFTPTAGTLTLTVSGDVVNADLEIGSTLSSHKPTLNATVTRAAETLTVPSANLPWPTPEIIGGELVTNGTFDTDISGWSSYNGASISWESGRIKAVKGSSYGGFFQGISGFIVGKVYTVTAELEQINYNQVQLWISDAGPGTLPIANGVRIVGGTTATITLVFVATQTTMWINFRGEVATGTATLYGDNITVREINPLSVSIQMEGRMTYADTANSEEVYFLRWLNSSVQRISLYMRTDGAYTGAPIFLQYASVLDAVGASVPGPYSPGILVPFNIASRHGSTFINGAVDGTALTADTTPVTLPNLSTKDLDLAFDYMGTLKTIRIWSEDIGDNGIEEASS